MPDELSTAQKAYLKKCRKDKISVTIARITLFVVFIVGWELGSRLGIIDDFVFSSPSRLVKCFVSLLKGGILFSHLWVTVWETLVCFAIVMCTALLLATLMWRFRFVFSVLEPYLVLLNSLPKSALAPVLIVWLGNNEKTIIIAAMSVAVFGAILSIYTCFISTDPEKIKLIRTLGGKEHHILFKLVIPASIPVIINTMKVNLGLCLVGVIIGEFLAAKKGLGYLIIYGSQVFKMDWVLLSIVILCLLSIILYEIISLIEKKISK